MHLITTRRKLHDASSRINFHRLARKYGNRAFQIILCLLLAAWISFSESGGAFTNRLYNLGGGALIQISQLHQRLETITDRTVNDFFLWYWRTALDTTTAAKIHTLGLSAGNSAATEHAAAASYSTAEISIAYQATTAENRRLESLLKLVTNSHSTPHLHAAVLNKTIGKLGIGMIIAAGTNHGIEPGNLVTRGNFLIGQVTLVTPDFARVNTIAHKLFSVDVIGQESGTRCIARGIGTLHQGIRMQLHHCLHPNSTEHAPKNGEILETAGFSPDIPAGFIIGQAISDQQLSTVVDLYSLKHVGIIKANDPTAAAAAVTTSPLHSLTPPSTAP